MEPVQVQRRTLRLLFLTQVIAGIGIAVGASVGALLAADIAGIGLSGLAISTNVVGAALFAVPATAIVHRYGRRLSLAARYCTAAIGSAPDHRRRVRNSIALLFFGFFLFGGATAADYRPVTPRWISHPTRFEAATSHWSCGRRRSARHRARLAPPAAKR